MYQRFMRQFDYYASSYCENDSERLAYLEQFTEGEPHEVVIGYSSLGASAGYEAAMRETKERYGNEEVIANAHLKRY